MNPGPKNGRVTGHRNNVKSGYCASCSARILIGNPKSTQTWSQRLHLTQEQVDLLLIAAAEYRDLSAEAGEYEEAVSFVDWLAPDALKDGEGRAWVEVDGKRDEWGRMAGHPDPIPVASLARRIRGAA
jgi:hypothetical protein